MQSRAGLDSNSGSQRNARNGPAHTTGRERCAPTARSSAQISAPYQQHSRQRGLDMRLLAAPSSREAMFPASQHGSREDTRSGDAARKADGGPPYRRTVKPQQRRWVVVVHAQVAQPEHKRLRPQCSAARYLNLNCTAATQGTPDSVPLGHMDRGERTREGQSTHSDAEHAHHAPRRDIDRARTVFCCWLAAAAAVGTRGLNFRAACRRCIFLHRSFRG